MRVNWATKKPGQPAPSTELLEPIRDQSWTDWSGAVRRSAFAKPRGGLWTSPEGSGYSWVDWCREEEMGWIAEIYSLEVEGEPRLLMIDSFADLEDAHRRFGWTQGLGSFLESGLLFEPMVEHFDGVWLTERGFAATRFSEPTTYGWDCETILWFRWCFAEVRLVEKVRP